MRHHGVALAHEASENMINPKLNLDADPGTALLPVAGQVKTLIQKRKSALVSALRSQRPFGF